MQFEIEVISKSEPTFVKTTKGGYYYVEVAYKRDGKVEGKKIMDFSNKKIFDRVKGMQANKVYLIETEKDANGYWQWIGVNLSDGMPEEGEVKQATTSVPRQATTGRVLGSNYETPDERKQRQRLIVRQSSISNALTVLELRKDKDVKVETVLDLASQFENWVYGEPNAPVIEMKNDDLDQDVPG